MLPIWFLYIAIILRFVGGFAYLRATLRGKAKPNPVSWLLWSVTPTISFISSISLGIGFESLVNLALGMTPFVVFLAAIYKNPRSFQLRGLTLLCAIIAVIGIALWPITHNPVIAISILLVADLAITLPTIYKTWVTPKSEFAPTFLLSATSIVVALFTITDWGFTVVAYPIYALCTNLLIYTLAHQTPRHRKKKKRRKK